MASTAIWEAIGSNIDCSSPRCSVKITLRILRRVARPTKAEYVTNP
ncbi:MAG: hypothetical protein JO304_00655 [Solirubrobacterales bacterium]|nr:hypothetical protein [Solirubrobacterales bacterium]